MGTKAEEIQAKRQRLADLQRAKAEAQSVALETVEAVREDNILTELDRKIAQEEEVIALLSSAGALPTSIRDTEVPPTPEEILEASARAREAATGVKPEIPTDIVVPAPVVDVPATPSAEVKAEEVAATPATETKAADTATAKAAAAKPAAQGQEK